MPQTHRLLDADDLFFTPDAHVRAGAGRDRLLEDGLVGVAIDGPFVVDTAVHDSLPVLGVFARPAVEPANFVRDATLVAVDLDGPGFVAVPALQSEKGGDGGSPGGGSGVTAQDFAFDARARLASLPWAAGHLAMYVVHRAALSNGLLVTLQGEDATGGLEAPAVAPLASGGVPGSAEDAAVVLRGPAVAVTEPGGTVLLEGSVRGDGRQARVHLLAVGPAPTPFVAALEVPLHDGAGTFSVNLLGDNPLPKAPGTWHLYAFCGEHVAGPVTIELTAGDTPW